MGQWSKEYRYCLFEGKKSCTIAYITEECIARNFGAQQRIVAYHRKESEMAMCSNDKT